jgi:hypothetical protein
VSGTLGNQFDGRCGLVEQTPAPVSGHVESHPGKSEPQQFTANRVTVAANGLLLRRHDLDPRLIPAVAHTHVTFDPEPTENCLACFDLPDTNGRHR